MSTLGKGKPKAELELAEFQAKLRALLAEARGMPLRTLQIVLDAERDRITTQMRDRGFYGPYSPPSDTPAGGG